MTIENLSDIQQRIFQNKINKGFNTTDLNKEFCLLYGEVDEAYDAWRKEKPDFAEELADIAIYLLGISEISKVDLGTEISKKLEIIEQRDYKVLKNGTHVKAEDIESKDDDDPSYDTAAVRDYFIDGPKQKNARYIPGITN